MPGKSSLGLELHKQVLCQTASGGVLQCPHIPMLSEPIQRIWSESRYVPQLVGDKRRIESNGGLPGQGGNRSDYTQSISSKVTWGIQCVPIRRLKLF